MSVGHKTPLSVEYEVFSATAPDAFHSGHTPLATRAGPGQGGGSTGGNLRQEFRFLAVIGGNQQGIGGQADRGEERGAEQVTAHRFQHRQQFHITQAQAPVLLGNMDGLPVHIGADAPPQFRVIGCRLRRHMLTHGGVAGELRQKCLGGIADHQLFFGELEIHQPGPPNTAHSPRLRRS